MTGTADMHAATREGYTLIECLIVLAVSAVLAGIAVPAFRSQGLRVARLDAVQALTRVQVEQEKFRAVHGLYSADIGALRGVFATSPQGRYAVAVELTGPESFRASASAVGAQQRDTACVTITLDVALGFATTGPSPACWNR